MRTKINLASLPYEDAQIYLARSGSIAAVLFCLTLALVAFTYHRVGQSKVVNQQISQVKSQLATLDREKASAQEMLDLPQNQGTVNRSELLNSIFARKAFSWTTVFSDMEKLMPPGLRVLSITPELDPQNQLQVKISVGGESRDRALTLVRNMERTPRFRNVVLQSDRMNTESGTFRTSGENAEQSRDPIRFELVARYLPSLPNDTSMDATQAEAGQGTTIANQQGGAR